MVIGSILGALLATVFNSHFVNVIYIIIAVLALILMFIKITPSTSHIKFNRVLLITIGSILGLVSGIVGAVEHLLLNYCRVIFLSIVQYR